MKPWARLVGLRPPHRPQANRQNRNLDSPPINNLIFFPGVPVLSRPPYRFYPDVYNDGFQSTERAMRAVAILYEEKELEAKSAR